MSNNDPRKPADEALPSPDQGQERQKAQGSKRERPLSPRRRAGAPKDPTAPASSPPPVQGTPGMPKAAPKSTPAAAEGRPERSRSGVASAPIEEPDASPLSSSREGVVEANVAKPPQRGTATVEGTKAGSLAPSPGAPSPGASSQGPKPLKPELQGQGAKEKLAANLAAPSVETQHPQHPPQKDLAASLETLSGQAAKAMLQPPETGNTHQQVPAYKQSSQQASPASLTVHGGTSQPTTAEKPVTDSENFSKQPTINDFCIKVKSYLPPGSQPMSSNGNDQIHMGPYHITMNDRNVITCGVQKGASFGPIIKAALAQNRRLSIGNLEMSEIRAIAEAMKQQGLNVTDKNFKAEAIEVLKKNGYPKLEDFIKEINAPREQPATDVERLKGGSPGAH